MITQKEINDLDYSIVGCTIEVHKQLGPGLLESVYKLCLMYELKSRNHNFTSGIHVPVIYKERNLGVILKLDLQVENLIVV
jgi:GxxExxY protein